MHLLSGLLVPSLIHSAADITHAFRAYDTLRRPRSQELVRRSREQGHILELELDFKDGKEKGNGEGERKDLKGFLERELVVNPRWVWNVDLEGMLERARGVFGELKRDAVSGDREDVVGRNVDVDVDVNT